MRIAGLRPGQFADVDGGRAGASGELAYHREVKADGSGAATVVLPAPSEGWRAGATYTFTVTADGQRATRSFVVGGGSAPTTRPTTKDSSGGVAKTGV